MEFETWYEGFKKPYETYDIDIEAICKAAFNAGKKAIQVEAKVKPATCGKCEDCKFWFISPEQEEMAKASGENIELHERCNNEDSFVYSLPTYNYFGCIHFSKLSV